MVLNTTTTRSEANDRPRTATVLRAFTHPASQWGAVVLGLVGSLAVTVGAAAVGPLPPNRPQQWWFNLPAAATRTVGAQVQMANLFYAGLALLLACWLVIGLGVRAGHWRNWMLLVLAAVWALPWLVAPVAMTTDVYTYLGQGLVSRSGLDAYSHGPSAIHLPDVLYRRIGPPDRNVPSPYGPIFLAFCRWIAPLAALHVVRAILLLRLLEVVGLVLLAVSMPRLARAWGARADVALWFSVVSPVVLASGVLSGHNDLLMIGLLASGLAVASTKTRFAYPLGIALCTLGALVKAPAAVGVVVLLLAWARDASAPTRGGRWRLGALRCGIGAVIVGALAALVSAATGLGVQWVNISALHSPATLAPGFTPVRTITGAVGAPNWQGLVNGCATAAAVVFAVLALWRQRELGIPRTTALIFAAAVLSSAVVWPWYLIWVLVPLAATPWRRGRVLWVVLPALALFVVKPDGSPQPMFGYPGTVAMAVLTVAAFAGGAWFAYRRLLLGRVPEIRHEPA